MVETTLPVNHVIQFKRQVASAWSQVNPTLRLGEPGFESDTGKVKIGNGVLKWNSLPYVGESSGVGVVSAVNGKVTTATTEDGVVRNTYVSTQNPSGGNDGDIWMVYS